MHLFLLKVRNGIRVKERGKKNKIKEEEEEEKNINKCHYPSGANVQKVMFVCSLGHREEWLDKNSDNMGLAQKEKERSGKEQKKK